MDVAADDDAELLDRYAADRNEAAFKELVRRYLKLVYSAACRRVGNGALAEDVTQAVFIILSQKHRSARSSAPLSAWLLATVRYAAANALKMERRRREHERAATMSRGAACSPDPSEVLVWREIAAELDDAVLKLGHADRTAVLLRFFQGKPVNAVARALNTSEAAATMRLRRAVDKLRERLIGRGSEALPSATAGLATLLAAHATRAAPPQLLASICAPGAAAGGAAAIAKGAIATMAWSKVKLACGILAGTAVLGTTAFVATTGDPRGLASPATLPTNAPATQPARQIALKVVDQKTGEPLAGARITFEITGFDDLPIRKPELTTSDSGIASADVPDRTPPLYSLTVTKPGNVPMRVAWRNARGRNEPIPDQYVLELPPAITIGGQVVDEQRQPVAGATVVFVPSSSRTVTTGKPNESVALLRQTIRANDDGKWSFESAPADIEGLQVGAWSHQADIGSGEYPVVTADLDALRKGTFTTTLERGVPIEGTVYGSDGKPFPMAYVIPGAERVASSGVIAAVRTDQNGKFTLRAKPGEQIILTVKAGKHAPDLKRVTVAAEKNNPVEFRLEAARTIKGIVLDSDGKPLEGVSVFARSWRGAGSLAHRITTKANGRFEWNTAPADAVLMDIYKSGYAELPRQAMTASDEDQVITLVRTSPVR